MNTQYIMKRLFIFLSLVQINHLFGQSIQDQIDHILRETITDEKGPGVVIGVVSDGEVLDVSMLGYANLEYDVPLTDSSVFELASVSKQFTSACIAILEKSGKLSLEDDVRKYIPELNPTGDTIRIKHLLTHTSGIRNHNVLLDLMGFDYQHVGYTNQSIQELMFRQTGLNNKPGDRMLYSNTNYVMLALIVKRVSGRKIHEFASSELFEPLGMTDSFYKNDPTRIIRNRVAPYNQVDGAYRSPRSLSVCVGAGGMFSTVTDMAKWMSLFYDPGHPLHYLKDFLTSQDTLNNGELMSHARGVFVSKYKGLLTINHGGSDWGLRAQVIWVPELELSVFVFANYANYNAVEIGYRVIDLFVDESTKQEDQVTSYEHAGDELAAFEGTYQELNSDMKMMVYHRNDTLFAESSMGRIPVPLVPLSNGKFCRPDNASITYVFPPDPVDADLFVNFGGATFYFEEIELTSEDNDNLNEFTGDYYSAELDVTYHLEIQDKELVLSYPNNCCLRLREGQKDVFGANRRTRYSFQRDEDDRVIAFTVASEGTVKDILFSKNKL